jgi:hypothetical protein
MSTITDCGFRRLGGVTQAAALVLSLAAGFYAEAAELCRIQVIDKETRWPAPLVELKTVHGVRFVTDNAGCIAFDVPELMGRETWFEVIGHGYETPADGFGMRGVRLTPQRGQTITVEVNRTIIAKRLGRVTGAGLFAESQKLGAELDWKESGILGCDSVQNAVYRGKLFWAWGDTSLARYPLGIFAMTGATTSLKPFSSFEPPLRPSFEHFTDANGKPRGISEIPGEGPTWIVACAVLPDHSGSERLVGTYYKVHPPMDIYEAGLCAWDDSAELFRPVRKLWTKSEASPSPEILPRGHSVIVPDEQGKSWVLFGDPLPNLRLPATFEAWQDPSAWERLTPPDHLVSAADGVKVKPHGGSVAWNAYRKRWITIFVENSKGRWPGGNVWYAEAASPTGPWGPAVKVLSHDNYAFYNPQMHPEFTPQDSAFLLFEGTYSKLFTRRTDSTPRYDYNQIMYRLDLNDPRLVKALETAGRSADSGH